jgi:nucleoid-associated protein YgaU
MASRYDNNITLKTTQGKPYYDSKRYPNIPLSENDLYVVTGIGDRLDNLAYRYYRDSNLWWVISMANNNVTRGSMFPYPGTQLRIPIDISTVLKIYNQFNS